MYMGGIYRASFKFCIGDKLREEMKEGKKNETFFSALKRDWVTRWIELWLTWIGLGQNKRRVAFEFL
jgi:hypothetical protein